MAASLARALREAVLWFMDVAAGTLALAWLRRTLKNRALARPVIPAALVAPAAVPAAGCLAQAQGSTLPPCTAPQGYLAPAASPAAAVQQM